MGLAKTREEGGILRRDFLEWVAETMGDNVSDEDQIDPRRFLEWSRASRPPRVRHSRRRAIPVDLSGTDGRLERYAVMPVRSRRQIRWLDASGYQLAVSEIPEEWHTGTLQTRDYDLTVQNDEAKVVRTF